MTDLSSEKAALRRALLARRRAVAAAEWQDWSRRAQEWILALPAYDQAATVMVYWPLGREVDTAMIVGQALANGKAVVLPRVVRWAPGQAPPGPAPVFGGDGYGLSLHFCGGAAPELVRGPLGLLEPPGDTPWVHARDIDLVVVPGVAFDRDGWRLGYGGGYYDRFLPALRAEAFLVGLAFGFQVVDRLPHDDRDRRVHAVAWEGGMAWAQGPTDAGP